MPFIYITTKAFEDSLTYGCGTTDSVRYHLCGIKVDLSLNRGIFHAGLVFWAELREGHLLFSIFIWRFQMPKGIWGLFPPPNSHRNDLKKFRALRARKCHGAAPETPTKNQIEGILFFVRWVIAKKEGGVKRAHATLKNTAGHSPWVDHAEMRLDLDRRLVVTQVCAASAS